MFKLFLMVRSGACTGFIPIKGFFTQLLKAGLRDKFIFAPLLTLKMRIPPELRIYWICRSTVSRKWQDSTLYPFDPPTLSSLQDVLTDPPPISPTQWANPQTPVHFPYPYLLNPFMAKPFDVILILRHPSPSLATIPPPPILYSYWNHSPTNPVRSNYPCTHSKIL